MSTERERERECVCVWWGGGGGKFDSMMVYCSHKSRILSFSILTVDAARPMRQKEDNYQKPRGI